MYKSICKSLLLSLVFAVPLCGKELSTFKEVCSHLKNGEDIRLVIDFDDCPIQSARAILCVYTEAHAVMLRPNYLQFSNSPLTTNHPLYPKTPVLENATYKISDSGEVSITMRLITLPDYQVINEWVVLRRLGASARVYTYSSQYRAGEDRIKPELGQ